MSEDKYFADAVVLSTKWWSRDDKKSAQDYLLLTFLKMSSNEYIIYRFRHD